MQLQGIFDIQLNLDGENLTASQKISAFNRACSILFSEVVLRYEISKTLFTANAIEVNKEYNFLNIGVFVVRDIILAYETYWIELHPKNYDAFDLKKDYEEDFRMVCEWAINNTTNQNIKSLRSIGLDETEVEIQDLNSIKELLRLRHDCQAGITV